MLRTATLKSLVTPLAALVALGFAMAASPAQALSRIKDLASVEGVRSNQILGYGIVVGLNGTGDTLNNAPFTKQSLTAMLERLGVNTRGLPKVPGPHKLTARLTGRTTARHRRATRCRCVAIDCLQYCLKSTAW